MEKIVQYKSVNYKVVKNGDDIAIQKEVNGSYVTITGDELNEFLDFINGRVVSIDVPVSENRDAIKSRISDEIVSGNIKTTDEISELLDKEGITDKEKEELLKELEEILLNNLSNGYTSEDLEKYREEIKERLTSHRSSSEYLLSDFYMYNGVLMHRMVTIDSETGRQEEVSNKQFELNQLVISKLIEPSLKDFAEHQEHLKSEYEIKTNIVGDTADYSFVGSKNSSTTVRDISVHLAKCLQEEVDRTEVLHNGYDEVPEEDVEQAYENDDEKRAYDNPEMGYDQNGPELQRDEPLKLVRKKKEDKYGYMNLPLILVLLTIFGVGLYFLTKYILLK